MVKMYAKIHKIAALKTKMAAIPNILKVRTRHITYLCLTSDVRPTCTRTNSGAFE